MVVSGRFAVEYSKTGRTKAPGIAGSEGSAQVPSVRLPGEIRGRRIAEGTNREGEKGKQAYNGRMYHKFPFC